MLESLGALTTITTVIAIIGGAVFYLKFTATKANIDGKNETIVTLEKSKEVTEDENKRLLAENIALKGQNVVLQGMATQTPEIVKLTESVTRLADGVAKQQKSFSTQNEKTIELLTQLVKLIKDGKE